MSQQVTPRTGAALVRATFPFAEEHRVRTWTELGITVGLFALTEALALAGPLLVAFGTFLVLNEDALFAYLVFLAASNTAVMLALTTKWSRQLRLTGARAPSPATQGADA